MNKNANSADVTRLTKASWKVFNEWCIKTDVLSMSCACPDEGRFSLCPMPDGWVYHSLNMYKANSRTPPLTTLCTSSITKLVVFLQLGPSKAVKIFQILNLIKQSVSIFGNKMDMGQNQEVILASHGHRQINPCLQGLILVKFARLTLPLNPSSSNTWIKRLVPFAQSIFIIVLRWALFMKTEDLGCLGSCE